MLHVVQDKKGGCGGCARLIYGNVPVPRMKLAYTGPPYTRPLPYRGRFVNVWNACVAFVVRARYILKAVHSRG